MGFTIVWPEGVIFGSIMTYHVQFLLLVRQPLFDRAALLLTQTSWVLPPLSVGKMTLRLYGALNYSHGLSLRLSQPQPIRRAQRQACLDRQIRVSPLATPRRAARRAPHTLSLITDPNRQITPLAQALVIFCPVDHPVLRLIKLVPSRCVELMWHLGYPLC